MAKESSSETKGKHSTLIVLTLGLLVGFVAGFVLILSSLPVDNGLADFEASRAEGSEPSENRYDFYDLLANRVQRPDAVAEPVESASVPLEPATRPVPANAQIIRSDTNYQEVPAAYRKDDLKQYYFLQAGRYKRHEEAQTMRVKVLMLGLEAFIVTREEADGQTLHRVRSGPYYDESLLTEAKKRLKRGGINYEIVRVTG